MSVFSNLQPSPHIARNAFDLSQRHVFSSKFGVIKPVACIDTMPNSHYEIDIKQLLRSQPLQTAAFTGFKVSYDVLFCPYNYLQHGFNQFLAGRGHTISPMIYQQEEMPYFSPELFSKYLVPLVALEMYLNDFIRANLAERGSVVTHFGTLRYFYFIETPQSPGNSVLASALRNFDMLGYGNFLDEVQSIYRSVSAEYPPSSTSDFTSCIVNFFTFYGIISITAEDVTSRGDTFDLLTVIVERLNSTFTDLYDFGDISLPCSNFFRVLAYNKFFADFYRSRFYTERFSFVFRGSDANYNLHLDLDALFNQDNFSSGIITYRFKENNSDTYDEYEFACSPESGVSMYSFVYICFLFCEKSHLYKRDLFTGVLPSTQFGDVSVVSSTDTLQRIISPAKLVAQGSNVNVQATASGRLAVPGLSDGALWQLEPATAFSILELRKSEALQRYNERLLRAGDDVKSVFEAHGWNGPSSQSLENSIMLGSFDGNFDLNVVSSTSETDNLELGQLASNGVATVNGKKIYFDTKDFGVIMVVMHTTKSAEYNSFGIDPVTQLIERFDFPFPEFQSISLQPVPYSSFNGRSGEVRGFDKVDTLKQILGYLPTSYYYKTAVDKVHGLFYTQGSNVGNFANWVVPKFGLDIMNESFYYCDLRAVDNIFKESSDAYSVTDKFFVNCYLDIKAVLPLPVIGLPD